MKIVHKDYEDGGSFYLVNGDKVAGEIDYSWVNENVLAITHTEVHPEYQGQGYAKKLVDASVDFARKNDYKIIPICPYAKTVMTRTPVYADVLVQL